MYIYIYIYIWKIQYNHSVFLTISFYNYATVPLQIRNDIVAQLQIFLGYKTEQWDIFVFW